MIQLKGEIPFLASKRAHILSGRRETSACLLIGRQARDSRSRPNWIESARDERRGHGRQSRAESRRPSARRPAAILRGRRPAD